MTGATSLYEHDPLPNPKERVVPVAMRIVAVTWCCCHVDQSWYVPYVFRMCSGKNPAGMWPGNLSHQIHIVGMQPGISTHHIHIVRMWPAILSHQFHIVGMWPGIPAHQSRLSITSLPAIKNVIAKMQSVISSRPLHAVCGTPRPAKNVSLDESWVTLGQTRSFVLFQSRVFITAKSCGHVARLTFTT